MDLSGYSISGSLGSIYYTITTISSVINIINLPVYYYVPLTPTTISGNYISLSNYIITNPPVTISSYLSNYQTPNTNYYIDHNYWISSGVYGKFYNYDYTDLSNNIIISANSYTLHASVT